MAAFLSVDSDHDLFGLLGLSVSQVVVEGLANGLVYLLRSDGSNRCEYDDAAIRAGRWTSTNDAADRSVPSDFRQVCFASKLSQVYRDQDQGSSLLCRPLILPHSPLDSLGVEQEVSPCPAGAVQCKRQSDYMVDDGQPQAQLRQADLHLPGFDF